MKLQITSLTYITTVFFSSAFYSDTSDRDSSSLSTSVFYLQICFPLKMINQVNKYFSSTYNCFLDFILLTLETDWHFIEIWSCARDTYFHKLIFIIYLSFCFFTFRELKRFIVPIFYRKPQNLTCDTALIIHTANRATEYRKSSARTPKHKFVCTINWGN